MSQYFLKPYERFSENVKVEIDLSNCARKADLKGASDGDTCNLAAKSDLPNLRVKVDKIDIYQLETVSAPLSKLNNIADNDVVKNFYDKLVTKTNAIAISEFVLETQYNTDNIGLGKKTNDPDKKNT